MRHVAQPGISCVDHADSVDAGNDLPQIGQQRDDEDTKAPRGRRCALPLARHFLAEAEHALHQPLESRLARDQAGAFCGATKRKKSDEDEDSALTMARSRYW